MGKSKFFSLPESFHFGAVLSARRKEAGLSQAELSRKVGATINTIGSWEKNKSFPDVPTLIRLSEVLDFPIGEFFPDADFHLAEEDRIRIDRFHSLSDVRLHVADAMLLALYEDEAAEKRRAADDTQARRISMLKESTTFVEDTEDLNELRAAAGTGAGYGSAPDKFTFVVNDERTHNANVIFTVVGHSMEPKYCPGDRVYVMHADSASDGQIVIALNGDEGYVIKLMKDGKLVSLNKDYPFRPERPDVPIFGIVTGKVKESDFCLPEDEKELKIIHADAIRQYLWEEYHWKE